ncbi:MAG: hypothetical protein FJY76_00985 [Candidatus Aenigmarchaeota archaeon]|nr:hypothetical protein [Candidatus Aenigmarchaeota archaeon]
MARELSLAGFRNIEEDFAIIVLTSGVRLDETNSSIVKELMKKRDMCLYVAINQPYNRMLRVMERKSVDVKRVFFIDCITETSGGKAERAGNCLYVNSPSNLTELGIAISQALHAIPGQKFLFMDALSTLVIYNTPNSFAKFAHFLMTRVKLLGLNGIFMVVEKEMEEQVFSRISHFSDRIIRLN